MRLRDVEKSFKKYYATWLSIYSFWQFSDGNNTKCGWKLKKKYLVSKFLGECNEKVKQKI